MREAGVIWTDVPDSLSEPWHQAVDRSLEAPTYRTVVPLYEGGTPAKRATGPPELGTPSPWRDHSLDSLTAVMKLVLESLV